MSNSLEEAIALACKAHAGQVDKAGQPYILHPLRLMFRFQSETERIVAVLHDAVEDSPLTISELKGHGFSRDVLKAIDCLTKRGGENYESFILRLGNNDLATAIKLEDLADNMNLTRLSKVTDEDLKRIEKYHRAWQDLNRGVALPPRSI